MRVRCWCHHYLTPAQFGTLELFYMTSAVISIFLGTQLSHATLRFYFDYDALPDRYRVISSSFILCFTFSALVLGVCALFAERFSLLLFDGDQYARHFVVLFVWLLLSLSNEILFAFVRALSAPASLSRSCCLSSSPSSGCASSSWSG